MDLGAGVLVMNCQNVVNAVAPMRKAIPHRLPSLPIQTSICVASGIHMQTVRSETQHVCVCKTYVMSTFMSSWSIEASISPWATASRMNCSTSSSFEAPTTEYNDDKARVPTSTSQRHNVRILERSKSTHDNNPINAREKACSLP